MVHQGYKLRAHDTAAQNAGGYVQCADREEECLTWSKGPCGCADGTAIVWAQKDNEQEEMGQINQQIST